MSEIIALDEIKLEDVEPEAQILESQIDDMGNLLFLKT